MALPCSVCSNGPMSRAVLHLVIYIFIAEKENNIAGEFTLENMNELLQ